jgi:hypothetical protein
MRMLLQTMAGASEALLLYPEAREPSMSAILLAVFNNHDTAEGVRTRLVKDGFPTDRVELISCQELGQVKLVPRKGVDVKLAEHFRKLFQSDGSESCERWLRLFQRAVLDGKAAIAVQPRGHIETQRAAELLNQAGAMELRGVDLENQTFEHAAAENEVPVFTWMGKVLAAPGAPDTTGLPRLP